MRFFVLTLLILLLLPFPACAEMLIELEESYLIQPIDEEVFEAGKYITEDMIYLQAELSLSLSEMAGTAIPLMGTPMINFNSEAALLSVQSDNERKNPSVDNGYYTINGNKDIVILGNEKQMLYKNATNEWNTAASFTLNVYNVGYLTYNGTTLCDIDALENGTDYSEFINNVTINGFSTNYEYRLELHNGQVTIWSKLPGIIPDDPFPSVPVDPVVPEQKTTIFSLLSSILLTLKRTRKN